MSDLVFGLDLDGVLVDLLGTAVRRCGVPLPFGDYAETPGYAIRSWGLSKAQVVAVSRELYSPETAYEADPIDGALDAWSVMERLGPIYVLTSRAPRYAEATRLWLARYGLKPQAVVFSADKGKDALDLGVTLALEDAPKHIASLDEAGVAVFRPDYPYNRHCSGTPYRSWADLFTKEPLASALDAAVAVEQAEQQGGAA